MKKVFKILLVFGLIFVLILFGVNGWFDVRFWHLPWDKGFVNVYDGTYIVGKDIMAGEYEGYHQKGEGGSIDISITGADGTKKNGIHTSIFDGFHINVEDGDIVVVDLLATGHVAMRRIGP